MQSVEVAPNFAPTTCVGVPCLVLSAVARVACALCGVIGSLVTCLPTNYYYYAYAVCTSGEHTNRRLKNIYVYAHTRCVWASGTAAPSHASRADAAPAGHLPMPAARRVTARDIANAGGLGKLIDNFIDQLRSSNMEGKERSATFLHSLTGQPIFEGQAKESSEENAVLIASAGGIAPLVALLKIGSAVAQMHACGALAAIALKRAEYQEEIVAGDGLQPITTALRIGNAALQQQAVSLLSSVSTLRTTQDAIIKANVIPTLIALLKGSASNATLVHACLTLANLADENEGGQNTIARAGAIPLLIVLLEAGKAPEAVATALARLCQGHSANRAEVTRLGGIPRLIALLAVINVEAQAQAAGALSAMASGDNQEEQDVIAEAGGIRGLLALVGTRYVSTQRSSVNALAMLARKNPVNQQSIAALGGIAPLVSLCDTEHPPEVQEQAVFALTEISRHNEKNQTSIADAGVMPLLVSLLRSSKVLSVEAELAGAFWALSEDHPRNKILVAENGAIPLLCGLLGSKLERASMLASHALASLALHNPANQVEIAQLLVNLLLTATSLKTQQRAAEAVWRVMNENLSDELGIAGAGGTGPLVRLLRDSQLPNAKAYALLSLSLSVDESNQKVVVEEGGVEPLVGMLNTPEPLLREQAACAVMKLLKHNTEVQVTRRSLTQAICLQSTCGLCYSRLINIHVCTHALSLPCGNSDPTSQSRDSQPIDQDA